MKILYVTTISKTVNAFLIPHIEMLINKGYTVDVACSVKSPVDKKLINLGVKVYNVQFSRTIFSTNNIKAFKQIKKIITDSSYDIVHTHTPTASAITRLACRYNKSIKVFYTAHGFSFSKGGSFFNWFLFYPIEKYLATYTDVLITINQEDYNIAKKIKNRHTYLIPGIGLDIKEFKKKTEVFKKDRKRKDLNLNSSDIVLTSVGELTKRKNHETIIKSLSLIKNKNIKYVVCGEGPRRQKLEQLIEKLDLSNQVVLLGNRSDIKEILQISNLFIFPSLREGLGIAAIEAMAVGLPVIASNRHGIQEYAIHEQTALTCDPNSPIAFKKAIIRLIKDNQLADQLRINAFNQIEKFDISYSLKAMNDIYESELN